MRGEWRAGVTPQITLYPTNPARPKVKKLSINAGPVAFPRATAVPIPAVIVATSRRVFCHGVRAFTVSASLGATGGAGAGGGKARTTGGRIWPWWTTIEPLTTSSSRSTLKWLSLPIERRNFEMLLEYKLDDCVGNLEGRSV